MCCLAYPAAAQLQNFAPCSLSPVYDYTIGNLLTTTNYTGSQSFPAGNYHVVGTLHFDNGTFTFAPGAKFYIDGKITVFKGVARTTGCALIIGEKAHLVAEGATFTAACNDFLAS